MSLMDKTMEKIFEAVPASQIARELGLSRQAVYMWKEVPVRRVLEIERITGIPRQELRPDIYPPDDYQKIGNGADVA